MGQKPLPGGGGTADQGPEAEENTPRRRRQDESREAKGMRVWDRGSFDEAAETGKAQMVLGLT